MSLSHFSTLATFWPTWPVIICLYPTSLPLPPSDQLDQLSYVSIPLLYPCHPLTNLTSYHMSLPHFSTPATFWPTWPVIICLYPTSLLLPPSDQLDQLSYVSIPLLYPCHLLTNLTCYHMSISCLSTLVTLLPTWPVIICLYPTSLLLPHSDQLDQLSYVSIPLLYSCHLLTNLTCYHMSISHFSTLATFWPTWPVIICLYSTSLPLPPSDQLDQLSYVSIPLLYPCHLLTNLTCYHMSISRLSTLVTFLPTWPVIICLYPTSLLLPHSDQLDQLSYVSIPLLYSCHLLTNLTCYHMSISHFSTLATFWPTWPVIICLYPTSLPLPPSDQLDQLSYVSIPLLYPCHPLTNLTSYHMSLSHFSTPATFWPTWPVIICLYPTSLPLPPSDQLDQLSYVSIPLLYSCHILTNLTCYHMSLSHFSTLATFWPTWPVIICLYPTSLPLPPSYQLDLLSYVYIPPLYPCHLLTNLTCYHMSLSHFSTPATFWPTWPVIICLYPTSLLLPPSDQLDLLSYVYIPPLYPCHLFTNLTCYHMSLSHFATLATFLPTWPVIICLYPTSLPLPPSYQLDQLSYVYIPLLYPCHLLTNLTCYHMSLSHFATLATFWPTWPVIICLYSTSLPLPPSYQLDQLSYVYIPLLYPCHLLTNLTCYHMSISRLSTLVTFLPTWPVIIGLYTTSLPLSPSYQLVLLSCLYPTALPLSPPYQLDLSPYVSITSLYLCHFRINLNCHHMCPSHISTFAFFLPTWFVIIRVYPTSLALSLPH